MPGCNYVLLVSSEGTKFKHEFSSLVHIYINHLSAVPVEAGYLYEDLCPFRIETSSGNSFVITSIDQIKE